MLVKGMRKSANSEGDRPGLGGRDFSVTDKQKVAQFESTDR